MDLQKGQLPWNLGRYYNAGEIIQSANMYRDTVRVNTNPAWETFLIDDVFITGNIATGLSTEANNGGYYAKAEPTAGVWTPLTTVDTNAFGQILNLGYILDATTREVVQDTNGRDIYALFHTTATDNTTIAPATGIVATFVTLDPTTGNFSAVSVNQAIDIVMLRVVAMKNADFIMNDGELSGKPADVLAPNTLTVEQAVLTVTADIASWSTININTWAASSGASTFAGDTITLPWTAGDFNNAGNISVIVEGIGELVKWANATYVNANTISFPNIILNIGDRVIIKNIVLS